MKNAEKESVNLKVLEFLGMVKPLTKKIDEALKEQESKRTVLTESIKKFDEGKERTEIKAKINLIDRYVKYINDYANKMAFNLGDLFIQNILKPFAKDTTSLKYILNQTSYEKNPDCYKYIYLYASEIYGYIDLRLKGEEFNKNINIYKEFIYIEWDDKKSKYVLFVDYEKLAEFKTDSKIIELENFEEFSKKYEEVQKIQKAYNAELEKIEKEREKSLNEIERTSINEVYESYSKLIK